MKVLRPKTKPWVREFACRCGALLEVTEGDCRVHSDCRDGAAYVFTCPECGSDNWVAKSVVTRQVHT